VRIGGNTAEINTEGGSNYNTQHWHNGKTSTGVFGVHDATFSAFICGLAL